MTPSVRLATLGTVGAGIPKQALQRAAVRATLAPSVHNTQPWRFVIGDEVLVIHADLSRQLHVLDPTCRQLIISCGCAVFNARVSLAADGYAAEVERHLPANARELSSEATGTAGNDPSLAGLDAVLGLRRTNRRQFADDPVDPQLLTTLANVASFECASLFAISDQGHLAATAQLSKRAEAIEEADPGYRSELRAWVSEDQRRTDGVPIATLPQAREPYLAEVPQVQLRNFGDPGKAGMPDGAQTSLNQCLLLLGTDKDDPLSWLRAGEALERVWLEVTRAGYAMSLFTQVIEVASTREELRSQLELSMQPHVLLRVGRAPATPMSRRRKLTEVLRHVPSAHTAAMSPN